MKNQRQSMLALALLVLMSLPALLFLFFQAKQWYVIHEMEERMERENLQTLRIPLRDVKWHKKGKEIIVEGRMFDVKSSTTNGNMFICTGLFDDKETSIKNKLHMLSRNDQQQMSNNFAAKFAAQVVFSPVENHFNFSCISSTDHLYRVFYRNYFTQVYLGVEAPPPKA